MREFTEHTEAIWKTGQVKGAQGEDEASLHFGVSVPILAESRDLTPPLKPKVPMDKMCVFLKALQARLVRATNDYFFFQFFSSSAQGLAQATRVLR